MTPIARDEIEALEDIGRGVPAGSPKSAIVTSCLIARGLVRFGPRFRLFGPSWLAPTREGRKLLRSLPGRSGR